MKAIKPALAALVGGPARKSYEIPLNSKAAKVKGRFTARNVVVSLMACILLWQLIVWSHWDPVGRRGGRCSGSDCSVNDMATSGRRQINQSAPLLVIHAYHGLSNRVRALASAMAIADATGRVLHLVWVPDDHIEATFHDLFENDIVVWNSLEPIMSRPDWAFFDKYNYMEAEEGSEKYKYIDDSSPNHIYVKSAYRLNNTHTTQAKISVEFNNLVPTREVREYFSPFRSSVCHGWTPCTAYIGVHVRIADPHTELRNHDEEMYTKEAWEVTSKWRELSGPHHFISELRRILTEKSMYIFVSTDKRESLEPFIQEFGDRVLYLDKHGCFNRSADCIKLALADLLLLAHSSHDFILGSYWSSFTEVAALAKNLKVKYAGVDFVAPGKHPLKCGTSEKGGVFDGLGIIVAAQDRHEMLEQTVPTWLSEESVSEIVLADWNSNPPLREALSSLLDTRLRIVEVHNATNWILTRALNIALRHSSSTRIMKLDADTRILSGMLKAHPLRPGTFYAGNWKNAKDENEHHLNGIFYVHREDLLKVNGFDERIETYGWDDEDFYERLQESGVKRIDLNLKYFHHLQHEDLQRMEHTRSFSSIPDVERIRNKELVTVLPPWNKASATVGLECQPSGHVTCQCAITSMPLGLKDHHKPEFVVDATLAAYREVAGYAGGLEAEQLKEVTSFQWYEAYLRRHSPNTDQWLLVLPEGTFGERVLGIQGALEMARVWNRKLQIVWKKEEPCMHSFEELFKTTRFEVVSEFYDFEHTWRYKGIHLDHGADWLSKGSPSPVEKYVFLVTRGPVGHLSPSVSDNLWMSLEPTELGQSMQHTLADIPVRPVLIVRLEGMLMERIFALMSTIQLGKRLDRRIVLVWDSKSVGGLEIGDFLMNDIHVVASVEELFRDRDLSQLPVYEHNKTGSVVGINWSDKEHIVVKGEGRIEGVDGTEVDYSQTFQKLIPTKQLSDEMYGLQVGKRFHGVVIGDQWDHCQKEALYAALKNVYTEANLTGSAYLFVLAEREEICQEVGEGVVCISMCGDRGTKACLMKYMATSFVMAQLQHLFFFSWKHKEVEFILRRGHVKSRKVECTGGSATTKGVSAHSSLVETLKARKLARSERTEDTCTGAWHLLLQIPILGETDSDHALRSSEYWNTLRKNLAHPEVKKIHIFTETEEDKAAVLAQISNDECKKLDFVNVGRRMYYKDIFEFTEIYLQGELCAILNADVYLGEGFSQIKPDVHLPLDRVLALSRYEKEEGHKCGYSVCNRYMDGTDGSFSHDTFLFKAPLPSALIAETEFHQQIGSDNVLIQKLKKAGVKVRNPCRSIKTYHNHCSGLRLSKKNDVETMGPWQTDERLDTMLCNKKHCGNGWVLEGQEVIEDLE